MTRQLERWGGWHFRKDTGTLEYNEHDPLFDVAGISDASHALSQIFEITKQQWATPEAINDLLRALDYLLDPENNYRAKHVQ